MLPDKKDTSFSVLAIISMAAITLAIYWPGLSGGFVFDDMPFLLENERLQVSSLERSEWISAALSFPANHQGRWLSMVTFAANHYFSGFDPYWFKLTNVAIHILNGILVFLICNALFSLLRSEHKDMDSTSKYTHFAALFIATAWLVLPINLTSVLYVAQRFESLSSTFIFLGLWSYICTRKKLALTGTGIYQLAFIIIIFTSIGSLAKESAILLPLYTGLLELVIFRRAKTNLAVAKKILALYSALLVLPLIVGSLWLASWIGTETSYHRPFSTIERLLTQSRVLISYIFWSLLPTGNALTLYHDDFTISKGILSPPQTLVAIATILLLLVTSIWQRNRRPLLSLGILWFFAGHSLTATIIPLELVFEHRNYFPSIGLLMVIASAFYAETVIPVRGRVVIAVAVATITFYSFSTAIRALEWGNPIIFAITEAKKRPQSARANIELARTLLIAASEGNDATLTKQAIDALEACRKLPQSPITCEAGLILIEAHQGRSADPAHWSDIHSKLSATPPSPSDLVTLQLLLRCAFSNHCQGAEFIHQLREALGVAASHSFRNAFLLEMAAVAETNFPDGDRASAEQWLREAIRIQPQRLASHLNLIGLLLSLDRPAEAQIALDNLKRVNTLGVFDEEIEFYTREIQAYRTTERSNSGGSK